MAALRDATLDDVATIADPVERLGDVDRVPVGRAVLVAFDQDPVSDELLGRATIEAGLPPEAQSLSAYPQPLREIGHQLESVVVGRRAPQVELPGHQRVHRRSVLETIGAGCS